MRIFRLMAAGLLAVVVFAGCADSGGTEEDPVRVNTFFYETPDGRVVECIARGNVLSCDWGNAAGG